MHKNIYVKRLVMDKIKLYDTTLRDGMQAESELLIRG
jgi:hypothetical protein